MKWRSYPARLGRLPMFLPVKDNCGQHITFTCGNGNVTFNGKYLTTMDEDIFIEVMNGGEMKSVEGITTVVYQNTLYGVCKGMGKDHGAKTYTAVRDSIDNLRTTVVEIHVQEKQYRFDFKGTVVADYIVDQEAVVVIAPDLLKALKPLKGNQDVTRNLDQGIRNRLSPLGKALHRYLACHRLKGFPFLKTVREAVAPTLRYDHFRQYCLRELERLEACGFLESYSVDAKGKLTYQRKTTRDVDYRGAKRGL